MISNHFHLLLKTGIVPIATLMRRPLTGYAAGFNRRHQRSGHVFQNRYKSILCQKDAYLQELVRYTHLNPLRAGLVKDLNELDNFRFAGHGVIMGKHSKEWQSADQTLVFFGPSKYRNIVKGRILICYWAVRELGFSMTEVANRLGISVLTVSVAVSKGEGLVSQEGVALDANI